MQILIVGSGGREHALALAVGRSPLCTRLFAAPGNPGIGEVATLVPIAAEDIDALVEYADSADIDFVIVGPDAPLALGLVDRLEAKGILAFGPTKAAARVEWSKTFTKALCRDHGIPTAGWETFSDAGAARAYVRRRSLPIVVKADGLAAGKGVTIARSLEEADAAIDEALNGDRFGAAGASIVVEDFLTGEEASFFALVDGKKALPLGWAQDHKAAFDGDRGPNTGGMGAYSPVPFVTPVLEAEVLARIVQPTVDALAAAGTPFRGVLFAGLMIVDGRPFLIEYNARFGDPECDVLMARLDCDIVPLLMAAAGGGFGDLEPAMKADAAMAVVVASRGYPGAFAKGSALDNLEHLSGIEGLTVLHAGTARDETGRIVSAGGRVLALTATGPSLAEARAIAYRAVEALNWPDGFCRHDIGWRAL